METQEGLPARRSRALDGTQTGMSPWALFQMHLRGRPAFSISNVLRHSSAFGRSPSTTRLRLALIRARFAGCERADFSRPHPPLSPLSFAAREVGGGGCGARSAPLASRASGSYTPRPRRRVTSPPPFPPGVPAAARLWGESRDGGRLRPTSRDGGHPSRIPQRSRMSLSTRSGLCLTIDLRVSPGGTIPRQVEPHDPAPQCRPARGGEGCETAGDRADQGGRGGLLE